MAFTFLRLGMTPALAVLFLMIAHVWVEATPINIVAIGASNTAGWGVGGQNAYPAQLEAMLRAKGYDAHVTNAGVSFETTAGMLRRIDSAVPRGTDIVILQPGGTAEKKFWRCVENGEPPRLFWIEPPRVRIEAVRVVDMSTSNSWAEFAGIFLRTREAYVEHERAKAELKALLPEDAKEGIGHGIRARRSKSGAVSFDVLDSEATHAPVQ
jgi:GDSL-like lipase/acylhydrolase family protein